MSRWLLLLVVSGMMGCASALETGYVPRKLGSSDETRRGYYAQPFTPEAKAAKDYEEQFGDKHQAAKPGY